MTDRKAVRALRYLAPNLITALGLCFGLLSLAAAYEGRYVDAGWFIIYAVLTDRLDGFVARLVRGTSELGVQLDSLADFLTFGICPAVLVFASLGGEHGVPSFQSGAGRYVLLAACGAWVLSATFRLARYNISSEEPGYPKIFFGVPTTLAAGLLVIWYLAFAKYAEFGGPLASEAEFGGPKLFGDAIATPAGVWRYFPLVMFIGGFLMASNLRMPKLGVMRSKLATAFVMANVVVGYVLGFARVLPEYLVWAPTLWLVVFLIWGQLSSHARAMVPPKIFPAVDPPRGAEPIRPEDDLLPEDEHEPEHDSLFQASDDGEHHRPAPR
jgi:CDP-diacylglycerol--serine O-phosphatidyltransferase